MRSGGPTSCSADSPPGSAGTRLSALQQRRHSFSQELQKEEQSQNASNSLAFVFSFSVIPPSRLSSLTCIAGNERSRGITITMSHSAGGNAARNETHLVLAQ